MDWFSWLSKTGLDPTLVYEYGLAFAQNELEEDDVAYFNHEFLQSMGIHIAKHRLEILKLARKERKSFPRPVSRILIAIKRTRRRFSEYLRKWMRREESALAIVPSCSQRKSALVKRNKRLMGGNKASRPPLLLTNGSPLFFPSSRINSLASPVGNHGVERNDQKADGEYIEYWSSAVEEIRWDTMFQNLKPT